MGNKFTLSEAQDFVWLLLEIYFENMEFDVEQFLPLIIIFVLINTNVFTFLNSKI